MLLPPAEVVCLVEVYLVPPHSTSQRQLEHQHQLSVLHLEVQCPTRSHNRLHPPTKIPVQIQQVKRLQDAERDSELLVKMKKPCSPHTPHIIITNHQVPSGPLTMPNHKIRSVQQTRHSQMEVDSNLDPQRRKISPEILVLA